MQNFPQLVIKFILKNIKTDIMVASSNLSWQGIKRKAVYIEGAGLVCKCTGQCTLAVYRVGQVHKFPHKDQVHKFPHMGKFLHLIHDFNS